MILVQVPEQPLTPQQLLDGVHQHFLVEQQPPSYTGNRSMGNGCKYRYRPGEQTLACAFGIFIPEPRYRASMEACTAHDLAQCPDLIPVFGPDPPVALLEQLQVAHDHSVRHSDYLSGVQEVNQPTRFRELLTVRLKELALRFELTYPSTAKDVSHV